MSLLPTAPSFPYTLCIQDSAPKSSHPKTAASSARRANTVAPLGKDWPLCIHSSQSPEPGLCLEQVAELDTLSCLSAQLYSGHFPYVKEKPSHCFPAPQTSQQWSLCQQRGRSHGTWGAPPTWRCPSCLPSCSLHHQGLWV